MIDLMLGLLQLFTSLQIQPTPDSAAWLSWGLFVLFGIGGLSLFLAYKIRQDQEKRRIIAERDKLRNEMENLWRLSDSMSWSLPIEESLVKMIKTTKEITGAHRGIIYLFDVRQEFLYAIAENEDLKVFAEIKLIPKSTGRLPLLFDSLKPIIVEDLLNPHPEDIVPSDIINDGNRTAIVIPLSVGQDVLGDLTLTFDRYLKWSDERVQLFSLLGRMIGKNIKNAKNSENLRELAVLQERKRLSQELHDNFSQLTSALSLRAEAALLSHEEGKLEKTRLDLERIIDTAHEVQQSLREEMIGLRSWTDEQNDLMPLIRDCVERFKQLSHIPVILDDDETPATVFVPAQIGSQFLRILQESLSNVRRHSQASQVVIRIGECGHRLCLEIEDDGRGFDPSTISPERLGLQIMQERARGVGGRVSIRSTVEGGTCIQVELPVFPVMGEK